MLSKSFNVLKMMDSNSILSTKNKIINYTEPVKNASSNNKNKNSTTILKRVIMESLVAFPEDAHQQILKYLVDAGLNETECMKFRQTWSKVVLSMQAFGRTAKYKIDPDVFSNEIIRELSYADEDVIKVINASTACLKLDHHRETINVTSKNKTNSQDFRNPIDDIASLDAINLIGTDLANALVDIYKSFDDSNKESSNQNDIQIIDVFESIGQFRKSLRGTRISWISSMIIEEEAYTPLDSWTHGYPEAVRGVLDMQIRSERNDLNMYMSGDDILGVVISNKQSIHQERAWCAYLCLNELLSSHGVNLFPLPIGIHRDPLTLSVTYAFESVVRTTIRLGSLFGPILSTYLRKIPIVIHTWCKQFAHAYKSLQACTGGSLMKAINIEKDVYVKDNGLLIIGNTAFDTVLPKNKLHYKLNFLRTVCDILSHALCISRNEVITLEYLDNNITTNNNNNEEEDFETDYNSDIDNMTPREHKLDMKGTNKKGSNSNSNEVILPIVVGSCMELLFTGHRCNTIILEKTHTINTTRLTKMNDKKSLDNEEITAQALSILTITIATNTTTTASNHSNYEHFLTIKEKRSTNVYLHNSSKSSIGDENSNVCTLSIQALNPGIITLNATALVSETNSNITSSSSTYFRKKCYQIQIIIIPEYPVESVLLQDLIGHLEDAYIQKDPEIILHSQLFALNININNNSNNTTLLAQTGDSNQYLTNQSLNHSSISHNNNNNGSSNNSAVQKGWQDIRRAITSMITTYKTSANSNINIRSTS